MFDKEWAQAKIFEKARLSVKDITTINQLIITLHCFSQHCTPGNILENVFNCNAVWNTFATTKVNVLWLPFNPIMEWKKIFSNKKWMKKKLLVCKCIKPNVKGCMMQLHQISNSSNFRKPFHVWCVTFTKFNKIAWSFQNK